MPSPKLFKTELIQSENKETLQEKQANLKFKKRVNRTGLNANYCNGSDQRLMTHTLLANARNTSNETLNSLEDEGGSGMRSHTMVFGGTAHTLDEYNM